MAILSPVDIAPLGEDIRRCLANAKRIHLLTQNGEKDSRQQKLIIKIKQRMIITQQVYHFLEHVSDGNSNRTDSG